MWAPDVYEGAPTPITAYMAAVVKAAAFVSFLRVFVEAFPALLVRWHSAIWWLAVVTMVVGNVVALAQRSIKRILAYSSIAHAGYLLVCIAVAGIFPEDQRSGAAIGSQAMLFYLLAYTLATMGAFAVLSAASTDAEANPDLDDLAGLWLVRPGLAVAMSIFMLALLGFPVFGGIGFFAKWYLLNAALDAPSPQVRLAVAVVLTSVVSAGYYLRVVMVMFMRPRREGALLPGRAGFGTRAVIVSTAVLIIVLGLYPPALNRMFGRERVVQTPTAAALSARPDPVSSLAP
jgi:NADH-quinone oxidoreductase subunit N